MVIPELYPLHSDYVFIVAKAVFPLIAKNQAFM